MGRPYADQMCPDCEGTGELETTNVTGWATGWITCHGCHGTGDI